MFARSRLVSSLQLALIVILGIWTGVYAGVLGSTTGAWLSASILAMTFFLNAISRQTEQPKTMSQILHDLENPRR